MMMIMILVIMIMKMMMIMMFLLDLLKLVDMWLEWKERSVTVAECWWRDSCNPSSPPTHPEFSGFKLSPQENWKFPPKFTGTKGDTILNRANAYCFQYPVSTRMPLLTGRGPGRALSRDFS